MLSLRTRKLSEKLISTCFATCFLYVIVGTVGSLEAGFCTISSSLLLRMMSIGSLLYSSPIALTRSIMQCAECGKYATMRCVVFMNAPEYQLGQSAGSVYCDRECQKGHWSDHRARCRTLGQRKKLLRKGNILTAAMLTYPKVIDDVDLTRIQLQEGVLCLHRNLRPITTRSKR